MPKVKELVKAIAFRYTRFGAPTYPYNLEPIQLATLVMEVERLAGVLGAIVEIGVGRGMTTRFLCEHILRSGRPERFVVIDTFSSFVPHHLEHEVRFRGKTRSQLEGFAFNDFEIWKRNFAQFPFVTAYRADCAEFDFAKVAPIKLALLDVDLYLPTKAALGSIFRELTPGGVIVVDDVASRSIWDGAHQAFQEFCSERGLPRTTIGNKGGIIRKPAQAGINAA